MTSPPVTAGLTLRLAADAFTGVSDGDTVAVWYDQSGAGNDAPSNFANGFTSYTPPVYHTARTPTGGPAMTFIAGDYYRLGDPGPFNTATSSAEMFFVVRAVPADNTGGFYQAGGNDSNWYAFNGDHNVYDGSLTGNRYSWVGGAEVADWHIYNVTHDGTTRTVTYDGTTVKHTVATPYVQPIGFGMMVGASWAPLHSPNPDYAQHWSGDIAEVLVYDHALTGTERDSVVAWLTGRHITGSTSADGTGAIAATVATVATGDIGGGGDSGVALRVAPVLVRAPEPPRNQIVIGDWRGGPDMELLQISNQVLTLNLTDPSTITFDVAGLPDPTTGRFDADLLHEGVSDVLWKRNGEPLALCRLTQATDDISATGHSVAVSCADYRYLLDRRLVFQDATGPQAGSGYKTYPDNTQISDIVWSLISDTQGRDGGGLGLTKGVWPASTPEYAAGFQVSDGDTVWSAIQKLAAPGPQSIVSTQHNNDTQLDVVVSNLPGFDLLIGPDRKVNMYYSMLAVERGVIIDYANGFGGAITAVNRVVDFANYANFIRQSGGDVLTNNPVLLPASDTASRPEGRWEVSVGDTNIVDPTTLAGVAAKNFTLYATLQPTYTLTLAPGFWNPDQIQVGDIVRLVIDSGRLRIGDKLRVTAITVTLDAAGNETVQLSVGRPKPDVLKFLSTSVRSLNRR